MNKSDTIGALALALSKVQGKVKDAYKAKEGHGYTYADLSMILNTVRPLCAANELSIMQFPFDETEGSAGVETIIAHSSGEWISERYSMPVIPANKRMSPPQAVGSTITYCRRYALAAALGISQHDNDAANVEYVTESDLVEVRRLIQATDTDVKKMCAHYGISQLEELTTDMWGSLLRVLSNKAKIAQEAKDKTAGRSNELKEKARKQMEDKGESQEREPGQEG
jgi:hypothetical protein